MPTASRCTVKSCVGSTWCRYGVDDSVGLAVQLENRYKGLRAPRKIKFGVSGCATRMRRGPEADRGRDRRQGWEPLRLRQRRHRAAPCRADRLRCQDRLLQLIDRFCSYVRTADRLWRTSTTKNLEGSPGLPQGRGGQRQPGPGRRTRGPDAACGGHLPVQVEDRRHHARSAPALSQLHQQRQARRAHRLRAGARPDPPGAQRGAARPWSDPGLIQARTHTTDKAPP
ncbi:Protein TXNRD3NB [Manis javanica]|nr:Protein TXNRD3NB [Manis javanica]